MTKKLPDLDYLAELSDEEARHEISQLPTPDERILGEVIRGIYKVSNDEVKEELSALRATIWIGNNPVQSALLAFAIGTRTTTIRGKINAANKRHGKIQNLYRQACESVELDLKYNNNPEWKHADYVNWILNQDKYNPLSRDSLKEKIRQLFRERGLDNRISNSKAKEVELIPKPASNDKIKEAEQTPQKTPKS